MEVIAKVTIIKPPYCEHLWDHRWKVEKQNYLLPLFDKDNLPTTSWKILFSCKLKSSATFRTTKISYQVTKFSCYNFPLYIWQTVHTVQSNRLKNNGIVKTEMGVTKISQFNPLTAQCLQWGASSIWLKKLCPHYRRFPVLWELIET